MEIGSSCSGRCNQGRQPCPHPDKCMRDISNFWPALLLGSILISWIMVAAVGLIVLAVW